MTSLPPDITLEIFGQQPSAALATPFLFCYSMDDPAINAQHIVDKLETGRQSLDRALRWTSGEVVQDLTGSNGSGVFKIRHVGTAPRVAVRDWREDSSVPSMQTLQENDFPASMLDEAVFSPFDVLPGKESQGTLRSSILVLQVNLIRGGMLLNISGHHQVLDGTGQEQVVYLLDKACRGVPFDPEEIRIGNLPRYDVVELFPDDWQPTDSRYLKSSPDDKPRPGWAEEEEENVAASSPLVWTNVSFSGESLKAIKEEAARGLNTGYVSTDDALTGCIWQSLCRARLSRVAKGTLTTMGRAINPRRYLDIPATYPGYISNMAYTTMPLETIAEKKTLGEVAVELRTAVDPQRSTLSQTTREFATLIHRARDKDSVSVANPLDLDHDLMVSSWASMRCHEFNFGMGLGLPVAFRRPRMTPVPNLIYLLPRDASGTIVMNMCIRQDDLDRLRQDPGFIRYARFIG